MENHELIDQVTAVTERFTPFSLVVRPGAPDFLGLPWEQSLSNWQSSRLLDVERTIHRHVVRCVDYDGRLYALKELPRRLAGREYGLLRHLEGKSVFVVQAIGIVNRFRRMRAARLSPDWDSDAVLITRYVDFSLPYRSLFTLRDQLLGALTGLLVHLHMAGFFWGDCSLSNILFRRDAGALTAYLVDAETGEVHANLSDGQRCYDLAIAEENVAGEFMDLAAAGSLPEDWDAIETAGEIPDRYRQLWSQLTGEEVLGQGSAGSNRINVPEECSLTLRGSRVSTDVDISSRASNSHLCTADIFGMAIAKIGV
jgi:hypothetical protein